MALFVVYIPGESSPPLTEGRSTNNCRVLDRGPEIELCIGDEGTDATTENDWSLLPFMALSDGAHAYDTISSKHRPSQWSNTIELTLKTTADP